VPCDQPLRDGVQHVGLRARLVDRRDELVAPRCPSPSPLPLRTNQPSAACGKARSKPQ
jgi:hypothetical protein